MAHMRRATQAEQLLSVLLLAGCLMMVSAQRGGGVRAGGGVRTTTTPVVTRPVVVPSRYVTGSSIGYSTSYPLRGVVVASALVWYGGHTYPAVRWAPTAWKSRGRVVVYCSCPVQVSQSVQHTAGALPP